MWRSITSSHTHWHTHTTHWHTHTTHTNTHTQTTQAGRSIPWCMCLWGCVCPQGSFYLLVSCVLSCHWLPFCHCLCLSIHISERRIKKYQKSSIWQGSPMLQPKSWRLIPSLKTWDFNEKEWKMWDQSFICWSIFQKEIVHFCHIWMMKVCTLWGNLSIISYIKRWN